MRPRPSAVVGARHVVLRAAGVSVVLDTGGPGLPRVLHWGADLGTLSDDDVADIVRATTLPVTPGTPDEPYRLGVIPEQSAGWVGTPGLRGHRVGADFSTALLVTSIDVTEDAQAAVVVVHARDDDADVAVAWRAELLDTGMLRLRAELSNDGWTTYDLAGMDLVLPLPRQATELLDFTGRAVRERSPQRHPVVMGTHLRESRRARAHDGTVLLLAGEPGFDHHGGRVWGVHVAWSGGTRVLVEKVMPDGQGVIGGGELLQPGEVRLAAGDVYTTPWVYSSYGLGLDEVSARFHDTLRARPEHPATPRKAMLNVWEAVYFDHDLDKLRHLADLAASVGIERFVLDDGWFRHRRDDTAGLGDWYVDEDVWPQGLHPLVDHVRGLGMEFGLWFEPEMVNLDSDLARAHPDWILRPPSRMPLPARHQQALDLANPDAFAHVHDRMHAILAEYPIGYVKWDSNRDLLDAAHQTTGAAGVHDQITAVYRMLATLRAEHPRVEFESCAGGGGRVDLAILSLTERIWASDCIDPLKRQSIEAGTGLLVPPEMIGSHIGGPRSHTTGRRHDLSFRAATALFSHLGVEWDLTTADDDELAELSGWIAAYRRHRSLLHHGRVVRGDDPDAALRVHGVVSHDGREAIFAVVQLTTSVVAPPGRVLLPGLVDHLEYDVRPMPPGDDPGPGAGASLPAWWSSGAHLTGRVLGVVGIQVPNQNPEHAVLLHAQAR